MGLLHFILSDVHDQADVEILPPRQVHSDIVRHIEPYQTLTRPDLASRHNYSGIIFSHVAGPVPIHFGKVTSSIMRPAGASSSI